MSTDLQLLDTPKRISLQSQSIQIRTALKDFERTFATSNDGRKPSKDDIKGDADVAAKYKEYSKIRDVLSGKLEYAVLLAVPKSPTRKQKHERTDSGVSWSPRRKSYDATPRRSTRHSDLELDNITSSASSKPVLLHAIGPTPQRDGKVLGLFDLLSNSAHSSRATPSSRKRKLDALIEDSPRTFEQTAVAQTPSGKRYGAVGDLLDHLTGTPETSLRKHSRTPISEGRKFMLSQFFATPSTTRFSNVNPSVTKERTPLRDTILGVTPANRNQTIQPAPDVTPAYLRRSTSFKDRLLSASRDPTKNSSNATHLSNTTTGPPTLKHLRSIQRSFDDLQTIFSDIQEENDEGDEDHEDELDALREMEDSQVNVLIKDSQQQEEGNFSDTDSGDGKTIQPLQKTWKKKGQKRTTRKAIMRPTLGPLPKAPKFVAAETHLEDDEEISLIVESQLKNGPSRKEDIDTDLQVDDEYYTDQDLSDAEFDQDAKSKSKHRTKVKNVKDKEKLKKTATINPNAVSHMNFRTLKIKNKNSKAKGRGKFGRGRR